LQEAEDLWYSRALAGRKGREEMDSGMLIDKLRTEAWSEQIYTGAIKSAFNSLRRREMRGVLSDHTDLRHWVDHFLSLRAFWRKLTGEL